MHDFETADKVFPEIEANIPSLQIEERTKLKFTFIVSLKNLEKSFRISKPLSS